MRTVTGPTDRVVVVGAGLGGLACALHLAAAGRQVTVVERESVPGGRAGRLAVDGYEFDTGPTVLTMPELIAEPLAAVGENLSDWLELTPLDPAYRAYYPDGSTLDVRTDTVRMAAEISRVCGPREADGYLRFVDFARRAVAARARPTSSTATWTPRSTWSTSTCSSCSAMGGFRRLQPKINQFFRDPRTQRIFSFQAMYAGPRAARRPGDLRGHRLPRLGRRRLLPQGRHARRAEGAGRRRREARRHVPLRHHGRPGSRPPDGRATGVITADGERIPADVVVLNPDLPVAYRDLLPASRRPRKLRYSPSCVVLHIGSRQAYAKIAHHNIHFGTAWKGTFDEVIRKGLLMSDPSLLVTNPTRTDPSAAPRRQADLLRAGAHAQPRRRPRSTGAAASAERYADELSRTLEQRGYVGFGDGIEVQRIITPADWADQGMAAGTPFAAAHTFAQTGPFRPGNLHPHPAATWCSPAPAPSPASAYRWC